MKKLSEFKDDQGAIVVAKLLVPIFGILQNAANEEAQKADSPIDFVSTILQNSPKETMEIFAILSEVDPKEYHTNGAEILGNVVTLASDEELMGLFGLRTQTET